MSFHDVFGLVGVALIVVAYLLLQLGKLSSERLLYSVMNGLGAALVIFSLVYEFNASAMLVEVFWLAISLFGIARCLRRTRS